MFTFGAFANSNSNQRAFVMIGLAFFALVLIALLAIAFNLFVRIRIMKHDTARDRLSWLSRGSAEVWSAYEELFPGSHTPRFLRYAFWTVVICAALVVVIAVLSKAR